MDSEERSDWFEPGIPRPLQISKRPEAANRSRPSLRQFSSCSIETLKSASEPDQPLTVPKRRDTCRDTRHSGARDDTTIPGRHRSSSWTSSQQVLPYRPSPTLPNNRGFVPGTLAADSRVTRTALEHRNPPMDGSFRDISPGPGGNYSTWRYYLEGNDPRLPSKLNGADLEGSSNQDSKLAIHDEPPPYLLVPRIRVTPEIRALDSSGNSFWAAIQVSAELSQSIRNLPGMTEQDTSTDSSLADDAFPNVLRFGCLCGVETSVIPTAASSILEVAIENSGPTALCLGSTILLLAHVQPSRSSSRPPNKGHARAQSEDLIEDLEDQLGSAMTEYLRVRVTYSHPGLPSSRAENSTVPIDGVVEVRSRVETIATALIKRHNFESPWSPPPAPSPKPLFGIIAAHWGADAAGDVMRRILASRSTPRKPAEGQRSLENMGDPHRAGCRVPPPPCCPEAPAVPRRQASLRRTFSHRESSSGSIANSDMHRQTWWSDMQGEFSSESHAGLYHRTSLPSTSLQPSGTSTPFVAGQDGDAGLQRARIIAAQRVLRKGKENYRISAGPDGYGRCGTKGQDPMTAMSVTTDGPLDAHVLSPDGGKRKALGTRLDVSAPVPGGRPEHIIGSRSWKGKKEAGRWGWSSWWQ